MENAFVEVTFDAASMITPISSGSGDAIIKPATSNNKYTLNTAGIFVILKIGSGL